MEIRLTKNGILVRSDDLNLRLDPKVGMEGEITFISHAHADHLPRRIEGSVISSEITRDIAELRRTKYEIDIRDYGLKMPDAGHVPGSRMLYFENGARVLYTGDFSVRKKFFSAGAKPIKSDYLIVDSTFGDPYFIFPRTREIMKQMKEWIDDNLKNNKKVALFGYPFGKSQTICKILEKLDYEYCVRESINNTNQVLEMHGFRFGGWLCGGDEEPEHDIVVAPMHERAELSERGFATAIISGWAVNPGYKFMMKVDEAFPLSDHNDFSEMISFVERCRPEKVFTVFGHAEEAAREIRKVLGIDASPLIEGQLGLHSF